MPEKRNLTENWGVIDPKDINTFLANQGFQSWRKAREDMTPQGVIEEIKQAGLRGGAAPDFPAALNGSWPKRPKGSKIPHLQRR